MDGVRKSASTRGRSTIESNAQRSDIPGRPWMTCNKDVDNSDDEIRPQVVHREHHRLTHRRIIDSIAWISERSDASSLTLSAIFWTAEMTVVWCLPPNARARSG